MKKIKESVIADKAIEYLEKQGWEIFKEVGGPGGRCDIVAKRNELLWAIECKVNFGLNVIEQALNWKKYKKANYISVAVSSMPSKLGKEICFDRGIGIFHYQKWSDSVKEIEPADFISDIKPFKLFDEQKEWGEAGTKEGGYFTPFKKTCCNLVGIVKETNGIELNKAFKELEHHYRSLSSAKQCLKGFINTNIISELEIRTIDKKEYLFLKEEK